MAESGLPGYETYTWNALFAPAGTPPAVIERLNAEAVKAVQDPEVKAKLALQGLYPVGMCGDEFAAYVRKRFDDYGVMIRESNIQAQ